MMSDLEFDILDELYFVISFKELQKHLHLSEEVLANTLSNLLNKGWVKCFYAGGDEIVLQEELDFETKYSTYHYLATKAGLLAHNSRE
jgi:DNA-binding Lrp family transcriptional regulator